MTLALHWFRNDLRLRDNTALVAAARAVDELAALYVFDERLLRGTAMGAPRVAFLLDCLARLQRDLAARHVPLWVRRGRPEREVPAAAAALGAGLVSFNRDTTPYARRRDALVTTALEAGGARVLVCKDRVVFEACDLRTRVGGAFAVYTPYQRAWYRRLEREPQPPRRAPKLPAGRRRGRGDRLPSPEELGFPAVSGRLPTGGEQAAQRRLERFLQDRVAGYAEARDRPDVDGTSRLSPYLRFGAISVRDCIARAFEAAAEAPRRSEGVEKWVDELVWREFYAAVLEEHPRVLRGAQRPEYASLVWDEAPEAFEAWCHGRTGYPLVDAGMRQLRESGWMHNRVRMVAASFLVKDLWIDWRRGERWFLQRLVDADPASNNGGWQWSASTGSDAAPYFRIFHPVKQGERCDPRGDYVRRWVPELSALKGAAVHRPWREPLLAAGYPERIVDHAERRELALERYQAAREARR